MRIGWVGLGKLGLPCAAAMARYGGHDVVGYDLDPQRARAQIQAAHATDNLNLSGEMLLGDVLRTCGIVIADTLAETVEHAEVIFCAVQTPHDPAYGGETPMPEQRRDFDYSHLVAAVRDISKQAADLGKTITIVVISTVLPGTTDTHLRPVAGEHVRLVYNPYFIAMSTVVPDFIAPEYVLLGIDQDNIQDLTLLTDIYSAVHDRPLHVVSIRTAELLKVAYNTFISLKIVYANTMMEICHAVGADCDDLTDGLALATDRITSAAYLYGGMGDGGSCHPRDNIAMSWLAQRLDLSVDLFGFLSEAREKQTRWLANLVAEHAMFHDGPAVLPVVVLGAAYKPETALTYGSPALLLEHYLRRNKTVALTVADPHLHPDWEHVLAEPAVFVIATAHRQFHTAAYPAGSTVIDPFGRVNVPDGVTLIRVGRR